MTGLLLALALLAPASPARTDCRLFSVDKAAYVAKNERVFRTIPVPPHARRLSGYSIGQPAHDACFPTENGPPYERFSTWHVYAPPRGWRDARGVVGWYSHVLPRRFWTYEGGSAGGADATFRRGHALLYVSAGADAWSISVDHAAYR